MRITGGERRGMKLIEPKGQDVRPTTDKVKAAIFNAIQWDVRDAAVFVDCFGGTGAMALEALSRGVKRAWIFDSARTSIQLIRKNVAKAHYTDRAHIVEGPADRGLDRLAAVGVRADLVFMDPPYRMLEVYPQAAQALRDGGLLTAEALLVMEHRATDDLALPFGSLRLKGKGSDAGHNGLKDIQDKLQTQNYARLRFGISATFTVILATPHCILLGAFGLPEMGILLQD